MYPAPSSWASFIIFLKVFFKSILLRADLLVKELLSFIPREINGASR
jgi:hypothetical protein